MLTLSLNYRVCQNRGLVARPVLLLLFVLSAKMIFAQSEHQLYYLSIGSGHYEDRKEYFDDNTFKASGNVYCSITSASIMKELFSKCFNAKGFSLISEEENKITREQIFATLDKLDGLIIKDAAKKPFVLVYYSGHGFGDDIAGSQLFVMGNFSSSFGKNLSLKEGQDWLMKKVVSLLEITQRFDSLKYDYMILIDCCRQGLKPGESKSSILNKWKMNLDSSVVKKFKYPVNREPENEDEEEDDLEEEEDYKTKEEYDSVMYEKVKIRYNYMMADMFSEFQRENEYHQHNPVVFASPPGQEIGPVPIPAISLQLPYIKKTNSFILEDAKMVGPVCRRSLLVINEFQKSRRIKLTVDNFVKRLMSRELDKIPFLPVTHYVDDDKIHADKTVLIIKAR